MHTARSRRSSLILHILSWAATLIFGVLIVTAKVIAQPGTTKAPTSSASISILLSNASIRASTSASVSTEVSTSASTSASPIDYAVVQSDEDFPKGISSEQKSAIGTGKVPIHREGPYRSPLAHPRFGGPATVSVGFVLNRIREYNIQTGVYQADFFLSLTADKPMPPITLTLPNASDTTETVLVDTPTFKLYRYRGSFMNAADLRLYPFDRQELPIEIEDLRAGVDQVIFEANKPRTALDETFAISGWSVAGVAARSYKHLYPTRFDRDDLYVSRYKFVLSIERFGTSAAFSVFVPAILIVLISLVGLWVPPEELEVRSNAGAPMLAAAVLFHYSLLQSLPSTGYLTRADKVMLSVYISLVLNMLSTWALIIVNEHRRQWVFQLARFVVPPVTIIVMLLGSLG